LKHEECHKKFREAANLLINLGEYMYTRTPKITPDSKEQLTSFLSFFKPFLHGNEPNAIIQTVHESLVLLESSESDSESTTSNSSSSSEEEEEELQSLIVANVEVPQIETTPI